MPINTDMAGLIGITLMLVSLTAQMLRSATALSLRYRVGLLTGMAAIASIPFPSFGLSLAGFVRGITGDLSIATLVLLALALVRALTGCSFVEERNRMVALGVFWIAAAFFYPFALGFDMFDPYRLGYGSLWFMGALLGLAVWAGLSCSALLALCLSLSVAAWSIGWYESTNLWDYLLDPWLAIYAFAAQIKYGLTKLKGKYMSGLKHDAATPAPEGSTPPGRGRTLTLAALGGALEFYDFIIFIFFAAAISQLFFPPGMPDWLRQVQTYGIFAAGYLARPLGGIIMAHFGDLLGRKRMFMLSILMMAVPTLLIGLLPTYAVIGIWAPLLLLALRVMQGAAIGGEVPGAWVFVAEHVPQRHVGFACGTLTAGLTGGILLGSLVATAVNRIYAPTELLAEGWRVPFIIGGAFGLVSVWLRQYLHETPVFKEMQAQQALSAELPLKTVVREHRPAIVLTMLMTWLLSAAVVVMILMTPALVQKLFAIPAATALQANSIATVFLSIGCILFGALADRFGAGRVLMLGCVALGATSWLFYRQMSVAPEGVYSLYALCGFFVGVIGVIPGAAVQAFPPAVRFSGLSFSYNVAYAVFGGLTPVLVSLLLPLDALAPAYYVALLSMLGVGIGAYLGRNGARQAVE